MASDCLEFEQPTKHMLLNGRPLATTTPSNDSPGIEEVLENIEFVSWKLALQTNYIVNMQNFALCFWYFHTTVF